MARFAVPACLAAGLLVAGLVFGLDPPLDLDIAGTFYRGGNSFVAQTPVGDFVRRVFYWIPTALMIGAVGLFVLRRSGRQIAWAPTGRGLLFLLLTFAVGPGLLANVILKDHSHRPRPYQTLQFGGEASFRPFYRFDGACRRNCSFVSGEGATSAWTLAPALLAPAPVRAAAIAAALLFALGSGGLRMAFGGHYLSDTIFAALFVWTVIWFSWLMLRPRSDAPLR